MKSEDFKGIKTELKAKILILPPDDDYKKGFNCALKFAIQLIESYEKGEGLFQKPVTSM